MRTRDAVTARRWLQRAILVGFFWTGPIACTAQAPAPGPTPTASAPTDPLPSWNDDATKAAIRGFVARVTQQGGSDFVPISERIATFDNDGTLWSEQPLYFQVAFALDRVKALGPEHPEWRTKEPFKSVLGGDIKAALASGDKGIAQIIGATHTGMTVDAFSRTADEWIRSARHPRFDRPYTDLVFQPMLELQSYLRANGFKTFIVSGGTVEFMRAWVERVYGIPPEQVVGSTFKTVFTVGADGVPALMREPQIDFIDDGPGKPVGISKFIGRRPILAFGNSDGDQQMLEWTTAGSGARFGALIHHTDAAREWAYDRQSSIGKLDKALDEAAKRGWTVVDMKQSWRVMYPFQK
jgi:hypothetical protein